MSTPSLFRGTATVGLLTVLSRILGFIRDVVIARLFGASILADIFFVALRIPNTLRSFIAEGAFTSAFIPVLADEQAKGTTKAKKFISESFTWMTIVTLILTLLGYIFAEQIITVFAPGFKSDPTKISQATHLLIIMLPYIPSISLVVLLNGVLTSVHRYGGGAWAQVLVNICLIIGAVIASFADRQYQAEYLAWSIFAAAFIQFFLLAYLAKKAGFPIKFCWPKLSKPIKQVMVLMVPALFGAAIYQLTIIINTALASFLPTGSISWLVYADRLAQLPVGVYTIALTSVLLPQLSASIAEKDGDAVTKKLIDATRYTIFLLVPLAVYMAVLSIPLMQLLFERGAFTQYDSIQSAKALAVYAAGLIPFSLYTIFSRHLIAMKKPAIPALIGFGSLICAVFVSLTTMGKIDATLVKEGSFLVSIISYIQMQLPQIASTGHLGLALSSVAASIFSLCCYIIIVGSYEKLPFLRLTKCLIKSLVAATGIALISGYFISLTLSPIITVITSTIGSAVIYLLINLMLKSKEAAEIIGILIRKSRV